MDANTVLVKSRLENGTIIYVQAAMPGGEEDVAFRIPSFKGISDAIEGIAESLVASLQKVKPQKASVEFGLEVAIESGELTALFAKGTATADLKITLEWGEVDANAAS